MKKLSELKIIKIMYMDNQDESSSFELDNRMFLFLIIVSIGMLIFIFFANDFTNFINDLNIIDKWKKMYL